MKITYSIQVCNESRELYSLVNFLLKVIDEDDNVQVIVSDSGRGISVEDKEKLFLPYLPRVLGRAKELPALFGSRI